MAKFLSLPTDNLQPTFTPTKTTVSQWLANIYPTNQFSFSFIQVCCIAANFHVETSGKEENSGSWWNEQQLLPGKTYENEAKDYITIYWIVNALHGWIQTGEKKVIGFLGPILHSTLQHLLYTHTDLSLGPNIFRV